MIERNFRTTDLISVLILYVYVAESFKITVKKGKICSDIFNLLWDAKESQLQSLNSLIAYDIAYRGVKFKKSL